MIARRARDIRRYADTGVIDTGRRYGHNSITTHGHIMHCRAEMPRASVDMMLRYVVERCYATPYAALLLRELLMPISFRRELYAYC